MALGSGTGRSHWYTPSYTLENRSVAFTRVTSRVPQQWKPRNIALQCGGSSCRGAVVRPRVAVTAATCLTVSLAGATARWTRADEGTCLCDLAWCIAGRGRAVRGTSAARIVNFGPRSSGSVLLLRRFQRRIHATALAHRVWGGGRDVKGTTRCGAIQVLRAGSPWQHGRPASSLQGFVEVADLD